MPRIRLTQLAADKIAPPPAGRVVYWDRVLPGFGLRVTSNGARSWIASYRLADGRKVMETIAPIARLPKVDDARQAARASMEKAASGDNPVAEKRALAVRAATKLRRRLRRPLPRALRPQPETEDRARVAPHLRA